MKTFSNIQYGEHKENLLDVFLPDGDGEFPLLVFFHGGGFEAGNKGNAESPFEFCEYLPKKGIGVVSAEYRMYPDAKYPDFVLDGASAVAWVKENIFSYGKCSKIFVGGSSAGGWLSMMLCFNKEYLAKHNIDAGKIDGFFHDAGQPTVHFNILKERGIDPRREIIDEAAPLYHIGTSESYPPMHFVVSDNDIPCRYEQIMLTMKTLEHFGYNMETVTHTVMHGTHTEYVHKYNDDGESIYGKMIESFINSVK